MAVMTASANSKSARQKQSEPEQPTFVLRCYVYRAGTVYVAECIDLDILAEVKTAEMAIAKLRDAVLGYLRVVLDGGSLEDLLPRPSPWLSRLRYHRYLLAAALTSRRRQFRVFDWSTSSPILAV